MSEKGRPKGSPNKVSASIKEVYEKVFHTLQLTDKDSLLSWAKKNPTDFYRLVMHLIPKAVEGNVNLNHKYDTVEIVVRDERSKEISVGAAAEAINGVSERCH